MNRRIPDVSPADVEIGFITSDRSAAPATDVQKSQFSFLHQLKSTSIVSGLVITWYIAAVISITTSKQILNIAPYPYTLCTVQVRF